MTFQPSTGIRKTRRTEREPEEPFASKSTPPTPSSSSTLSIPDKVDTLIIGLVALDTVSTLTSTTVMHDSNPGSLKSSVGGVGYNVSMAYKYGLESQGKKGSYRFVSAVGDDFAGHSILKQINEKYHDISGISVQNGKQTAQYSAILDSDGLLLLACADMAIMEDVSLVKHVSKQIERAQPRFVVVDCNLLSAGLDAVIEACSKQIHRPKIIVEPTSQPKLARIAGINSRRLSVFPNCNIHMITPTSDELSQIHQSFAMRELFDDYDYWFPVLDSLGIDSTFRDKMSALAAKNPTMKALMDTGVLQQSFQLLPYTPNILVKLGPRGCVLIKLSTSVADYKSVPTTSAYAPEFTLTSIGREVDGNRLGVVVQYFPIPSENEDLAIVNVTGAGDSLLGYLSSTLVAEDWMSYHIESLEQEWAKWESIYKSQLASGKSLVSEDAVSREIGQI